MLKETINADLKTAMLSGDKHQASVLRDLKSAILNREVAEGKRDEGLSDEEIVSVFKKEQKTRRESLQVYKDAGEAARADEEQFQLDIIERYLPEELGEEEVQKLVKQVIVDLSESESLGMKDMGRIIASVKASASNADGSMVAKIVKQELQGTQK